MKKLPLSNSVHTHSNVVVALLLLIRNVSVAQTPSVSIDAPSAALLGESFGAEIRLDNSDTSLIGYDPVVELILPALPIGEEGSVFPESATPALSLQSNPPRCSS